MSLSEQFNFGRKIKELKRINKKSYADLTAELKISRERIIALEESEREPTEIERQRFAAFYNLPVEEFLASSARVAPQPPIVNDRPSVGNERPSMGNERPPMSNPRPPMAAPTGNMRPPMSNDRPPMTSDRRPAPNGGMGQSGIRAATNNAMGRPAGAGVSSPPKPKEPGERKPKETANGEPKPVMKYTAEQLGDIESAYLRKQRDLKVPLRFTFLNGKEFTGVILDFTPFTIHIKDETTSEEVILRKLAIAYYRKADALEEKDGGKD